LLLGKPLKIEHSSLSSLERAVSAIKEAEEAYSIESRVFLEPAGACHYPLFCYFRDKGLNVFAVNPIITKNSTNINIRKVQSDKFDSIKIALIGLKPDLKTSVMPSGPVLDLRNLMREYYSLMDSRSAYAYKLQGQLRMVFPQFLPIFSKAATSTALALLDKLTSPKAFLEASRQEIIGIIRQTARFGIGYAEKKCDDIKEAAATAMSFGHSSPSNFVLIRLYIGFIRKYSQEASAILMAMHELADTNPGELFVRQIRLVQSIKGAGFLTAAALAGEIGNFSLFKSPKQLFAYFGLDPSVMQSGKFTGTDAKMSKRGSALARRAIYTIAPVSIGKSKSGVPHNPVLYSYYKMKCESKLKMAALGAVMHKVCNIVFAVLRDNKEFAIIAPEEHKRNYQKKLDLAC
jgi:transposase